MGKFYVQEVLWSTDVGDNPDGKWKGLNAAYEYDPELELIRAGSRYATWQVVSSLHSFRRW